MRDSAWVVGVVVCGALLVAAPSPGQWSSDPAANLVLADRSGDEGGTRIVARSDGGFYVSWLDNTDGGYDVVLQRLDAAGVEMWPHNGVLVADRGFSYTVGYGLAVDAQGNALLAFRDDRSSPTAITVAKVSAAGAQQWGPTGVQVSAGGSVIAAGIAATTDGRAVVAWTEDGAVRAQKLNANGTSAWASAAVLSPPSGSYSLADVEASSAGAAIVAFVHSPSFGTNHLLAQKLASADGAPLWGSSPHVVYDAGSLQMGSFPPFAGDGAGGAVFAWYVNSDPVPTYLDVRVQRVLADGTEAFSHQGVVVSTDDAHQRVDPSAAFLPANQETVVFWTEMNSGQSEWGVYAQKLDVGGSRQWTDSGVAVTPIAGAQITNVVALPVGDGGLAAWSEETSATSEAYRASCLDHGGGYAWATSTVPLKTGTTQMGRVAGAVSTFGYAAYAWDEGVAFSYVNDVVAQNVNRDGILGAMVVFADGFESGGTTVWSASVP